MDDAPKCTKGKTLADLCEWLWYDYEAGIPIPQGLFILERIWDGETPSRGICLYVTNAVFYNWLYNNAYTYQWEFTENEQTLQQAIKEANQCNTLEN